MGGLFTLLHFLAWLAMPTCTLKSWPLWQRLLHLQFEVESTGGFEVGMELVVKAYVRGKRITEIPSVWTDRTEGESRFALWKWLPKYLRWYLFAFRRYLPA